MKNFTLTLCIALILQMSCESVCGKEFCRLYRCENKEVVCYVYDSYHKGGLSCKFKEGEL